MTVLSAQALVQMWSSTALSVRGWRTATEHRLPRDCWSEPAHEASCALLPDDAGTDTKHRPTVPLLLDHNQFGW